jgi:hypothetical protein
LDQLSNVIARQKEIGLMISDELDHQADLLDNTERNVDDSHNRVANARRRLDQLIIIIVTKVK